MSAHVVEHLKEAGRHTMKKKKRKRNRIRKVMNSRRRRRRVKHVHLVQVKRKHNKVFIRTGQKLGKEKCEL